MRTRVYIAVLFVAAALLLGGVFFLGGSAGDLPSAAAAGTTGAVGQVTVWGVVSRIGTLVLVVGGPIAFLYWLATVNVGSVDTPGRRVRDRSVPERVEDAAYETVHRKSD